MPQSNEPTTSAFWLRRSDRQTIGMLAIVVIVGMAMAWFVFGGATGGLVEVDRQPRREAPFRVDLNTAQWPELTQLPGVGETLARRIVESREKDGPFPTPDALLRVSGIGPKKYERIKPLLLPIESPAKPASPPADKQP